MIDDGDITRSMVKGDIPRAADGSAGDEALYENKVAELVGMLPPQSQRLTS